MLLCVGNIAYWARTIHPKEENLLVNHTFQKQSELSQYDIVTVQGKLKLSVPTQKATRKGLYKDVELDYSTNWQVEHWRSIENAYLKSPFFLYYGYKLERIYKTRYKTLLEFNLAVFEVLYTCIYKDEPPKINNKTTVYFSNTTPLENPAYPQVFDTTLDFQKNASILDLLFNLGPETQDYLASL